jgi:TonB family protein
MSAVWAKLETHVVNGAYPLQHCVGSTDHSGVFLTQSTSHAPSAVALKLIRFDPDSAQLQLARWQAAAQLSHPHLLRIFEVGECDVDGLHCLFARMEFADQTLEQVLERRALTEQEVRDMLVTTLGALEYLHRENRVHGGLKPSNFLVVGNQLKLSVDTVRALDDAGASTAADIFALGVTLCEALTRVRPAGLAGTAEVALPAGLPASFREIASRCLRRDPRSRPDVAELQAWLRGDAPAAASGTPVRAPATRLVIRVELPSEGGRPKTAEVPRRASRRVLALVLGGIAAAALGWIGYRAASTVPVPKIPPRVEVPPTPAPAPVPASEPPRAQPAEPPAGTPVNEVLPDVSRSALETIRGTVRVSVRLVVAGDGTVVAATTEDAGPSRYFERRSLEAARKWTFAPMQTQAQRPVRVRFAFTRFGVTATAEPLQVAD